MFLKRLSIQNESISIRDISFHKGINLIVDETRESDLTESGNNVGKTTVLRLIHYCLGGSGKNIYQDEEFKNQTNVQVEEFLTENNIIIQLDLAESLEEELTSDVIIRRNFLKRTKKIQDINGETFKDNKIFQQKLKEIVFRSTKEKPTFKQIVSKNIRDEKSRLLHTVKVLNAYTRTDEYEALFLFWLGIDLDFTVAKQKLIQEIKIEQKLQNRLSKESSPQQLEQFLAIVSRNITGLVQQKNDFNLNENYETDLENLNQTKAKINRVSSILGRLEIRKELIVESKIDLEADLANINTDHVKSLYDKAKSLIPNLQKTFEETIDFHNQMIKEKLKFILDELPSLEFKLKEQKSELQKLIRKEKELASILLKSGAVEELEIIISKLNEEYERKGKFEEQKRLWESSIEKETQKQSELTTINKGIEAKDDIIQERIKTFNKYFSDISQKLYDEQFALSSRITEKGYTLEISSLDGNLGTGKKKGQILSFDLAYIQFAEEMDIKHLNFILHDQIENVHENQINTLLNEVVLDLNCQLILSVLKDKLPASISVSDFEVLSLSQTEKLFKI